MSEPTPEPVDPDDTQENAPVSDDEPTPGVKPAPEPAEPENGEEAPERRTFDDAVADADDDAHADGEPDLDAVE